MSHISLYLCACVCICVCACVCAYVCQGKELEGKRVCMYSYGSGSMASLYRSVHMHIYMHINICIQTDVLIITQTHRQTHTKTINITCIKAMKTIMIVNIYTLTLICTVHVFISKRTHLDTSTLFDDDRNTPLSLFTVTQYPFLIIFSFKFFCYFFGFCSY